MSIETLFAGVGGTIIGTILGTFLSGIVTYGFQKKLLKQQLAFEKKLSEEDAHLRKKICDDWAALFTEFRNMVNTRLGRLQ